MPLLGTSMFISANWCARGNLKQKRKRQGMAVQKALKSVDELRLCCRLRDSLERLRDHRSLWAPTVLKSLSDS
jgi:hypothetical protein